MNQHFRLVIEQASTQNEIIKRIPNDRRKFAIGFMSNQVTQATLNHIRPKITLDNALRKC